ACRRAFSSDMWLTPKNWLSPKRTRSMTRITQRGLREANRLLTEAETRLLKVISYRDEDEFILISLVCTLVEFSSILLSTISVSSAVSNEEICPISRSLIQRAK